MGQRSTRPAIEIQGTVAPGFESVKELFEKNFIDGRDENAQLCVYVGEEKVVDLWCSLTDTDYSGDSLVNVFSATKSLTALAVASLVDRGLITYEDKIAQHWPDFAQNGKQNVTIAELMRHESGLSENWTPLDIEDTLRENIKKNAIGSLFEKEELHFPSDEVKRDYHAITRGWIANEIFRRVDPKGRTIGEYLLEDISEPLKADVHIGLTKDRLNQTARVKEIEMTKVMKKSMSTSCCRGSFGYSFGELMSFLNQIRKMRDERPAFKQYKDYNMDVIGALFNDETVRSGEMPSANGNCSARGLALVAAALANKGTINGVQVLSSNGWEEMHKDPAPALMNMDSSLLKCAFTQGGVNVFEESSRRRGYIGWGGYGGSVFQWDPELRIGFAYTPTLLLWYDQFNEKGALLQQEVTKCVQNLKK